jgi:hypothetical protein
MKKHILTFLLCLIFTNFLNCSPNITVESFKFQIHPESLAFSALINCSQTPEKVVMAIGLLDYNLTNITAADILQTLNGQYQKDDQVLHRNYRMGLPFNSGNFVSLFGIRLKNGNNFYQAVAFCILNATVFSPPFFSEKWIQPDNNGKNLMVEFTYILPIFKNHSAFQLNAIRTLIGLKYFLNKISEEVLTDYIGKNQVFLENDFIKIDICCYKLRSYIGRNYYAIGKRDNSWAEIKEILLTKDTILKFNSLFSQKIYNNVTSINVYTIDSSNLKLSLDIKAFKTFESNDSITFNVTSNKNVYFYIVGDMFKLSPDSIIAENIMNGTNSKGVKLPLFRKLMINEGSRYSFDIKTNSFNTSFWFKALGVSLGAPGEKVMTEIYDMVAVSGDASNFQILIKFCYTLLTFLLIVIEK